MKNSRFSSFLIVFFIFISVSLYAQDSTAAESQTEIFLIESFVPTEIPTEFHITFYTSESCKSRIVFKDGTKIAVSDSLTENHKAVVNLAGIKADSTVLQYNIEVFNQAGVGTLSDRFEVQLPEDNKAVTANTDGGFSSCLYGAVIYAAPIADGNFLKEGSRFGISKELPLVSFYQSGYNYPVHFISAEYSYMFNKVPSNYLRLGWKYLFKTETGRFVIAGINGFSDFKGSNGISPEVSWGMLSFQDVFTLFVRYRYSADLSSRGCSFSTVSLGLYSWFFSLHR